MCTKKKAQDSPQAEKQKRALITASVASMIDLFNRDNIQLLRERGWQVEIASNFSFGSITSRERVEAFRRELAQMEIPVYDVPIPRKVQDISNILKSYQKIKRLCTQNHYGLIHTQSPIGGVLTRLAAAKSQKQGTRVIYTAHGFHFYKGAPLLRWLLFYPVERWLAKYTDTLIVMNEEDARRARHFAAGQVCYVPGIGVHLSQFQPDKKMRAFQRKAFGFGEDDFVVISVGQLSKRKNQAVMIRAMALIQKPDIRYVLIGLGECGQAYRRLITKLNLQEKVFLAGYRSDVKDILQMADCFAFPSLQEGLPVSLMEAMAAGIPAVCSSIRGNRDLIRDGVDGILVPARDVQGFAQAVRKLSEDPKAAQRYARSAKKRIQKFGIAEVNRRMEQIYDAPMERKMECPKRYLYYIERKEQKSRMRTIKIFVSHTPDRNAVRLDLPFIYNVTAGSDYQTLEFPAGMYRDNQGEHISAKNKSYCELTTQYWAWKNQQADYYGFCHYRRYFSFQDKEQPESCWGTIEYDALDASALKALRLDEEAVRKKVEAYDFLIAKGIKTKTLGAESVYAHYQAGAELHIQDLELLLAIIQEKYPYLGETAREYVNGNLFYPCNMFIMCRPVFMEYSSILFAVLEEFEKRADMSCYSREGYRTIGHLGERMAGIYYQYLKKQKKHRLGELQIALIKDAEADGALHAAADSGAVPIVLAANQNYVPVLYVCAKSITDYASAQRTYEIIVFHTDITKESRSLFAGLEKENISFHFIDVKSRASGYILQAKQHITTETFYRFFILDILKDYPKAVYLDCDMIIRRDIAQLYDTPLNGHLIAAVKDADFAGQCNRKDSEMRRYCENVLGIENPFSYFQAGVLVFNITKMRQETSVSELLKMSDTGIYRFSDQDILNIICRGRVTYLDMAWNVLSDCNHFRWHGVIQYAPYEILDAYEQARRRPYIIHYAGFVKPWMHPDEDFGSEFWKTARGTIFYEKLLADMCRQTAAVNWAQGGGDAALNFKGRMLMRVKKAAKALLPQGSRMYGFAVRVYLRMISRHA